MIWGSGGSKSRLAKAAGAEPAGQMRDEKLHAVVARSTYASQNVQNTWVSEHFWKLRCRKSARRCGAKHICKSKCTKHTRCGPLLAVEMSKKCTPLWREAHFEVKMYKTPHVRATFGGSDVVLRGRRKGLCALSKVSNTWGFCSLSRNDGRCGAFEEDIQRCISRGRCSTKDMFIRDVRRSGRWFPERGCILEYQIFRFAEMISRDRCSTSYDLASFFRGRRSTLHRWSGKIAKRIGTRLSALHSTFEGSLAEFFRFWCLSDNYTKVHYTTLHYTTLHYLPLHFTTLNYTTLHHTTTTTTQLHSATLHYTPLHYTKLNYTTLRYATLHYTTLHYTTLHYTTLPSTTLHYITLQLQLRLHNYTTLRSTTLNYATLHYITLHYSTTLHYTTLHYTTLHWMTLHHR